MTWPPDPYLAFVLSDDGLPIEERRPRFRLNLAIEECDLCASSLDPTWECDQCGYVRDE